MKRALLLFGLILASCSTANAQGWRYDSVAFGRGGYPAGGVTVAVCTQPAVTTTQPCSPLATLYTDATLGTPCSGTLLGPGAPGAACSNPMLADSLGNFHFYTNVAVYTVQFYGSGITPYSLPDQNVGVASLLTSNNTWSGSNTFSFATTTLNGGTMAGSWAGSPTWTGSHIFNNQIISGVVTGTAPFSVSSTTLTPNLNVATLDNVTPSNQPAGAGQVCTSTSTTACSWQNTVTAGYKTEGINVVPVTVSNSNAATNLQTVNIPANEIGVAQTFYIDVFGAMGATGSPTFTLQVNLDAVQIGVWTFTAGTANNQGWILRYLFTGITTGVGGTILPQGVWAGTASEGGFLTANSGGAPQGTVTIDTTAPHVLALKVTWSAANALNTITSQVMNVHRIN